MKLGSRGLFPPRHIFYSLYHSLITLLMLTNLPRSQSTTYFLKERHQVPDGWKPIRRAPSYHQIQLQIGLKQSRFHELEQRLNEVSDPSHTRYGQYLNAKEVGELLGPSTGSLPLVEDWLRSHRIAAGSIHYSPALNWISLDLSISAAENLLQTKYLEFWHEERNVSVIRTPEWSLPEHLHDLVDTIQPTNSFLHTLLPRTEMPRLRDEGSNNSGAQSDTNLNQAAESFSGDPSQSLDLENLPDNLTLSQACNASAVTPLCIRTLYGMLNYKVQAPDQNSMALVNYHGEFNNRSDIHHFLESFRPEAAKARAAFDFRTIEIAGATNQQTPATAEQLKKKTGREGNLDAQILLGIAFPTPLIAYSTAGKAPPFMPDKYTPNNTNEPFLSWLLYILAQKDEDLPLVVATSYGDIEQTIPYSYAKRVCEGFAQLGARGVTVVFGAGDSGVGKPGYCQSNNGSNAYEFLTSFPASCPYGTSVGATRNVEPEEIVAYNDRNGFVSGGGFSRYFPRPAYQNFHGVVDSYLDRLGPGRYRGLYNRTGRAYPDVAAQGFQRVMVWNDEKYTVDGTSASAPTFAAVVALVNDALLAQGKPPLGFLNPWLYKVGFEAFTDIVNGSNKGCNTSGFPALEGWDSASGFGTPWFPRFKAMALERRFRSQRPWYYWPPPWLRYSKFLARRSERYLG